MIKKNPPNHPPTKKQENGSKVIFHVGNDRPKWAPQQYFYFSYGGPPPISEWAGFPVLCRSTKTFLRRALSRFDFPLIFSESNSTERRRFFARCFFFYFFKVERRCSSSFRFRSLFSLIVTEKFHNWLESHTYGLRNASTVLSYSTQNAPPTIISPSMLQTRFLQFWVLCKTLSKPQIAFQGLRRK